MTAHEETGRRVGATAAGRPRSIPPGRNAHTMTTDPNVEPCTAHIVNEHSAGTHHCTLEAGHTGGQFDGDHAGPVNDKGVRYCWSDRAIGAVPHHSPAAPAGLGVSATPSHTDLRDRIAAALREHGMVHLGDQVPADEYDCCADAVLAELPEPEPDTRADDGDRETYQRWLKEAETARDEARLQLSRVIGERNQLARDADDLLQQEADLIVAHCPKHGPKDQTGFWLDCHCAVADDMRRRAAAAVPAVPTTTKDGDTHG